MSQLTIGIQVRIGGVLTDVTTALLSNQAGTAGLIRDDTLEVLVPDGTPFVHDGTGLYSYTFTEPATNLTYTYWPELLYAGATYRWEDHVAGATETFAAVTAATTPGWLTYQECIEYLESFTRGAAVGIGPGVRREAVVAAYEEVIQAHEWLFLRDVHPIQAYASQTTGTISYDHATRIATLTGATFPAWATGEGAALYLDDMFCTVEERLSATQVRLTTGMNPGADVTAGSYTLFMWFYPLPADVMYTAEPVSELSAILGQQVAWGDLARLHRWTQQTGAFRRWCIGPNPNGGDAMYVYPAFDSAVRLDLPIKKRPREIRRTGFGPSDCAGTIAVNGTAVIGTGTIFAASMAGAILRISDTTVKPDGRNGDTAFFEEREISSVADATHLTLKASATSRASAGYRVTDPLSVGRHAWDAVLKGARKQLGQMADLKNQAELERAAFLALHQAKAGDAKEQPRRVAWSGGYRSYRLVDSYVPD